MQLHHQYRQLGGRLRLSYGQVLRGGHPAKPQPYHNQRGFCPPPAELGLLEKMKIRH
jgi:hypothetical protein